MDINVLAKVGDIEITRDQMVNIMKTLPQQQAMEVQSEEGRKRLLDEMIAGELLYLDAKENNLEDTDAFKAIVEDTKRSLLQRYALEQLIQKIEVTDEETEAYYEKNAEQFQKDAEVSARHILVSEEDQAKEIKAEIDGGLDFSEAAKKYSTCPSKEQGGQLGSFSRGRMVPEFEEAAFNLEIGEMSELVKTQFGYHLIVVDAKTEATKEAYENVKAQIVSYVTQQKQMEVYSNKVADLKNTYKVELNEEGLK